MMLQMNYLICHLTTVHSADDVRIFYKECMSLSKKSNYHVVICAPGNIPIPSKIMHYKIKSRNSIRPIRILMSQITAAKLVFKIKADIWHLHDPELLPMAVVLIILKRKVVWDSHENYFEQFDRSVDYRTYIPRILRPFLRYLMYALLRYIDANATGIVCATKNIASSYRNPNLEVVGNESILNEFILCKPSFENKNALYIGQPSSMQHFYEIVEAIERIPELNLVVACRNFNQDLRQLVLNKLGKRFIYLGWLDRKALADVVSHSTIGFVTYSSSLNHSNNKPNKYFEFCAAGLPIVATPTKSNIELIKSSSAGILADGFDSNAIEFALKEIIASEKKWQNLSESGKQWAKLFGGWENSELALLDLYRKILQ